MDAKKSTWWILPCLIFGVNSLAVWVFSQLGMKTLMAIHVTGSAGTAVSLWKLGGDAFASSLGAFNGSLAFAVLYVLFWLGVMGVLYRRRIFIKL